MGRGVSTPCNTLWSVFLEFDINCTYHECTRCGHAHYSADVPEQCEECGLSADDAHTPFLPAQHDQDLARWEWEYLIDDIKERLSNAFPSLIPCNQWLGREDRAILENRHVYIGVSEYCGDVSVWCVPKEEGYDRWAETNADGLHKAWARRIEKRAERLLKPLSHHPADWAKAA